MEITPSIARRISQFAWVTAAAGTVIGQLHALARAQAHPDDFVESPLARVWGEPAIRGLRPLLDWSDPYTVYVTYGKIWLPVCLAFTAAAYLVYRRRHPERVERRLWQLTLAAYAVMTLSVFGDYFTPWMDQMFILGIGAMMIIGVGGIATVDDVMEFLVAGASAVQLGTVNFYDPTAAMRIVDGLPVALAQLGAETVGEIIGLAQS